MKDEENKDPKPPVDNPDADQGDKGGVASELESEIDGAVDVVVEEKKAEAKKAADPEGDHSSTQDDDPDDDPDDKDDLPKGDEPKGEEKKKETDEDDSGIPDELTERAVKAGMSISDVKTFQDAKALENVVGMLERKDGSDSDEKPKAKENEEEEPDVDALIDQIPDLDPDDYDENVVAGMKVLKALAKAQQKTIKSLTAAGSTESGEWFDTQVSALGDDFAAVIKDQPEKQSALKAKFDVISAGYEASGEDVGRDVAFNEAVAIVFGDVVAKKESVVKSEKLSRRTRQHTSRPTGAKAAPTTDAFEDVAGELDRKFFDKK